jgi:hypothetical protein
VRHTVKTATALPPQASTASPLPIVHATSGTGLPPWTPPLNVQGGADEAGLYIGPEGDRSDRRFYAHLDIFVDGSEVRVPADLGVDGSYVSELHTRTDMGLIEVDPAAPGKRYTLGQFFIEWGVRIEPTHIGGLAVDASNPLGAYVNGVKFSGDPAAIELKSHTEIAIVYGKMSAKIPASYTSTEGN